MKKEVIKIEICRSYKENCFRLRIGDIKGSIEFSNSTKEEVLKEILDEIDNLEDLKNENN